MRVKNFQSSSIGCGTLTVPFKYVMKPEEKSDFMSKLKNALAKKIDDDTPLNKTAQKVLMSCLGQRDMTSNECVLPWHTIF